jgi:endonuclease YncB( thermonuclease family)/uncharacterized membrane protein
VHLRRSALVVRSLTLLLAAASAGLLLAGGHLRAASSAELTGARADRHAAEVGEGLGVDVRLRVSSGTSVRWAVYLSDDENVTRDDRRLGSWHSEVFAAASQRSLSTLVTLPSDLPQGSYHVGVLAQVEGSTLVARDSEPLSVGEAANLRAHVTSRRSQAAPGDELEIVLDVTNGGMLRAGPTSYRLYLSRNTAITRWDRELSRHSLQSLAASASRQRTLRPRVPSDTPAGSWYLGVILDSEGTLSETEEGDNAPRAEQRVVISAGGVDLVAESLEAPDPRVAAGSTLTLHREIRNAGGAPSGRLTYSLVLSRNSTISAQDPELRRGSLASLDPSESSQANLDVRIPSGTAPGSYWVGLRVDPDGDIPEVDEGNNALAAPQRISIYASGTGAAELQVTDVAPEHRTVRPGEDLQLQRRIENSGGDAAPFTYVVVLSRDARISTADRELYRFRFSSGLAGGATHVRPVNVRIPRDIRPGEYTLGVILDVDGEVLETDETNNARGAAEFVRVDRGTEIRRFDPQRVYVSDGDTIRVGGKSYRLMGYDTPEKASPSFTSDQEPHASRATSQTRRFLRAAQELALHVSSTDQYGRTLAHAFLDGESLAKAMIEAEHAYESIRVFGDGGFSELADELIDAQRGHYPEFQKPWLWRWSHSTR